MNIDNIPDETIKVWVTSTLADICANHGGWNFLFRLNPLRNDLPSDEVKLPNQEWKLFNPVLVMCVEAYYSIRVSPNRKKLIITYGDRDVGITPPELRCPPTVECAIDINLPQCLRETVQMMLIAPERYPLNQYGYT